MAGEKHGEESRQIFNAPQLIGNGKRLVLFIYCGLWLFVWKAEDSSWSSKEIIHTTVARWNRGFTLFSAVRHSETNMCALPFKTSSFLVLNCENRIAILSFFRFSGACCDTWLPCRSCFKPTVRSLLYFPAFVGIRTSLFTTGPGPASSFWTCHCELWSLSFVTCFWLLGVRYLCFWSPIGQFCRALPYYLELYTVYSIDPFLLLHFVVVWFCFCLPWLAFPFLPYMQ